VALKTELVGLGIEACSELGDYGCCAAKLRLAVDLFGGACGDSWVELGGNLWFFPQALNCQFRTVSDKGNPTV